MDKNSLSMYLKSPLAIFFLVCFLVQSSAVFAADRPRARDIGLLVGTFPTGLLNAITDVEGVRVGHTTIIEGEDVPTRRNGNNSRAW